MPPPNMTVRCRCPHPEHRGTCALEGVVECPDCGVRLCGSCSTGHHDPRHTRPLVGGRRAGKRAQVGGAR